MKFEKILNTLCFLVMLVLLANDGRNLFVYSRYINESPENLTSAYQNVYYAPYRIGGYEDGTATVRFGVLGGNHQLGTLTVTNATAVTVQTRTTFGALKILFADRSAEYAVYKDLLLEGDDTIDLEAGVYQIYLIGSWFSGACTIKYSDAVFERADSRHQSD